MVERKKYKIGEIATVQTGPFGSQLHQTDYVTHGIPIITVEHLGENRIIHSNLPCVSEEDHLRLSKYTLQANDIVFSRVGSVDRRALVREAENGWLFSGRCLRVRTQSKIIDPQYLSFYFGQETFKEYIRGIAVGATMPSINTKILSQIELALPPIEEQKAIAGILSSFDDKIEVNRRMNATLEEMARALFKAWFVDFEPVHANRENRPSTSASPEIAKLFPSAFENNIPKGWRVGTIADIASISKDSVSPGKFPDEEFHHFSIPAFDDSKHPKKELGSTILSNKFLVKRNSVLVSKLNPRIFRVWTVFPPKGGRCIASTEFIVYEARQDSYWSFLNSLVRSDEIISSFRQRVTGTSGSHQRVKPESTLNIPIVIPSDQLVDAFDETIAPSYLLSEVNIDQSRSLSQIRDSLLPRLIQGKLSIGD